MKKDDPRFATPDKETAAVCGLFCPGCSLFLATSEDDPQRLQAIAARFGKSAEEIRCRGCRSDVRSFYCRQCRFVQCAAEKGIDFCGECADYPCAELREFQAARPHRIELWQSQERIRTTGLANWYREMLEHFACPACGTLNSCYDEACRACGNAPANGYTKVHREEIARQLAALR